MKATYYSTARCNRALTAYPDACRPLTGCSAHVYVLCKLDWSLDAESIAGYAPLDETSKGNKQGFIAAVSAAVVYLVGCIQWCERSCTRSQAMTEDLQHMDTARDRQTGGRQA